MPEEHEHKDHKKEETIQISKTSLWQIVSGVLGLLLVISIFTGGFGLGSNNNIGVGSGSGNQPVAGNNIPTGTVEVDARQLEDDDPFLGEEDAPVTIVEFSDFQCPFCRKFWGDALPQIKSQYIDTGKVKFVYRDFPLENIHPGARPYAESAQCANDQGKFWEMHDKIFQEQDKQGQGTVQFNPDDLKKWASEIGLDTNKFNNCLDSGKYSNEVSKDLSDATSSGGQGTPYFIIGKTPVSGAQPFSAFQQVIEAELSK